MNLPKAIEILTILESRSVNHSKMFKKDALKLGIEALKAYQQIRPCLNLANSGLLPGETKEAKYEPTKGH